MSEFIYDQLASYREEMEFVAAVALGSVGAAQRVQANQAEQFGVEFPEVVKDLLPEGGEGALNTVSMNYLPDYSVTFLRYGTRVLDGKDVDWTTRVRYRLPIRSSGLERTVESVVGRPGGVSELTPPDIARCTNYSSEFDDLRSLGLEFGFNKPSRAEMEEVTQYIRKLFPRFVSQPDASKIKNEYDGPPTPHSLEQFVKVANEVRVEATSASADSGMRPSVFASGWRLVDAEQIPEMTKDLLPDWPDSTQIARISPSGPLRVEFGSATSEIVEVAGVEEPQTKAAFVEYSVEGGADGGCYLQRRVRTERRIHGVPIPRPECGDDIALGSEFGFTAPSDGEMFWVNNALRSIFSRSQ